MSILITHCSECGRDLRAYNHGRGCSRIGLGANATYGVESRVEPMFPLPDMDVPPRPDPDPLTPRKDWRPLLVDVRAFFDAMLLAFAGFWTGARAFDGPWWTAILAFACILMWLVVRSSAPGPNDPPRGSRGSGRPVTAPADAGTSVRPVFRDGLRVDYEGRVSRRRADTEDLG